VQDLMAEFQIQQGTILNHLFTYLQEGYPLRVGDVRSLSTLPPTQQNAVLEAFVRLGAERLKPVFEAFDGTINYEELSILRVQYVLEHQEGGKRNHLPSESCP
jgi:ATP-dependent DNA helicase RecQ